MRNDDREQHRRRSPSGVAGDGVSPPVFALEGLVVIECPRCSYGLEVNLVEIRTQVSRYCRACKARLDLRDADASLFGAEKRIASSLDQLVGSIDLTIEI